jgi:Raf kinase inhibitor-like YbhB/YbcL family protein
MGLSLTSSAFRAGHAIPANYTCDGANISPPLAWSGVPSGTKSIALIVEDPDAPNPAAPQRIWIHWILYNVPLNEPGLPAGLRKHDLPQGTREGLNSWERTGYEGPCPPIGRHRYVHKLFALDTALPDLGTPGKAWAHHRAG